MISLRPKVIPLAMLAAVALAPASLARAQECAEGRVSTPETLGRCCWPGQAFSEALSRCTGVPQCPAPFVSEGDACVPPFTAHYGLPEGWPTAVEPGAPPLAPVVAADPTALRWPDEPPMLREALFAPRLVRGTDDGLVIAGLSTFLAGYVAAFAIGLIDEAAQNCFASTAGFRFGPSGCGSWPYAFIPVVGGVLAGTTIEVEGGCCRDAALGLAAGIPAGMIQVLGIVLGAIGLAGAEHLEPSVRREGPVVSVVPWVSDREGGTWLHVEL